MDRPRLAIRGLLVTTLATVLGTTGCGTQQADGTDSADGTTLRSRSSFSVAGDASTVTTPPLPDRNAMNRLHDAGIAAVGDPIPPGMTDVSYAAAVEAARADNGGLMVDGIEPSAARFGRVSTPNFGTTLGSGVSERVIPALDRAKGWLLLYENVVVPVNGGRGPQFAPSEVPGASEAGLPQAEVSLVVVVDGVTGEFLFARSF